MQQLCVGSKLTRLAVLLQPVLLPNRGKGAANALMLVLHPPYMWARLTAYLRWLTLLRTRRDKGRGSSIPPHMHMLMYQYSNISPPS